MVEQVVPQDLGTGDPLGLLTQNPQVPGNLCPAGIGVQEVHLAVVRILLLRSLSPSRGSYHPSK